MWADSSAAATHTTKSSGGNFLATARHMYGTGGVSVFFRGCVITMQRDSVFGVVYEGLRRAQWFQHLIGSILDVACSVLAQPKSVRGFEEGLTTTAFLSNMLAALIATVVSSPINYVRSILYGTPVASACLPKMAIMRFLWIQMKYALHHGESYRKIAYHSADCKPLGRHYFAAWKVLNRRLNVGWGSLRVGLGMATGQYIFALVQAAMKV
jgi:hypothetical protein